MLKYKSLLSCIVLFVSFLWSVRSLQAQSPITQINSKIDMEELDYSDREYLFIMSHDDGSISLSFNIEDENILALGEEMNEIREEAYMNGYNWDAFMNYYLAVNAPDILDDMESDPEAGTYVVYFVDGASNRVKVKRLAEIIVYLVEHKEVIFKVLREKGEEIEWD